MSTSAAETVPSTVSTHSSTADVPAVVVNEQGWNCWCSFQNDSSNSVCTVCTTPKTQVEYFVAPSADLESKGENGESVPGKSLMEALAMVLVVRTDLGLGRGKIAEQCCLATLGKAWQAQSQGSNFHLVQHWTHAGARKQIRCCKDEPTLKKLEARSAVCGVPALVFSDNDQPTVLVVGPATTNELELITGQLPVLSWQDLPTIEGQGMDDEKLMQRRSQALVLLNKVLHNEKMEGNVKKLKPNAKCHCGSSKKYKKCCASKDIAKKEKAAEMNKLLASVAGQSTQSAKPTATPGDREKHHLQTERVARYRKQGEYGVKKYIKP